MKNENSPLVEAISLFGQPSAFFVKNRHLMDRMDKMDFSALLCKVFHVVHSVHYVHLSISLIFLLARFKRQTEFAVIYHHDSRFLRQEPSAHRRLKNKNK